MKRAAAIIGPTPSFVRWTISHQCAFRPGEEDEYSAQASLNPAYDTFRQLRALRELSLGYQQQRVIEGFCIHGQHHSDAETARGFPVDEVFDLYASREQVANTCGPCPVNARDSLSQTENVWAGCYGWFFANGGDADARDEPAFDLIEAFEKVTAANYPEFARARRLWFGVWQTNHWAAEHLKALKNLLADVMAESEQERLAKEFVRFVDAVNRCVEHGFKLHTELVPRGDSDGIDWRIEPHCSTCHIECAEDADRCEECGSREKPRPARKRKVLGLRPYMLLKDLIGTNETQNLIKQFKHGEPNTK